MASGVQPLLPETTSVAPRHIVETPRGRAIGDAMQTHSCLMER